MATVTIEQKVQDLLTQGKPCTEEEIRTLLRQDEEASILLVLQLLKRIEELESRTAELSSSPSTPSGMIPPYAKPSTNNGKTNRDYCPHCRKHVEPKIESALPRVAIGNRLLCLTAYWNYALGMTISQILDTFNFHLHFTLSKGGLIQKWHQLRLILLIWYEALAEEIQNSAVLHADETGWRVDGKTHWLWCFTNEHTTFYMVDRSRGSPALKRFFKEAFDGILVTDFGGSRHFVLSSLRCDRVRRTTVLPRASPSRTGKGERSKFVGGMEGVF